MTELLFPSPFICKITLWWKENKHNKTCALKKNDVNVVNFWQFFFVLMNQDNIGPIGSPKTFTRYRLSLQRKTSKGFENSFHGVQELLWATFSLWKHNFNCFYRKNLRQLGIFLWCMQRAILIDHTKSGSLRNDSIIRKQNNTRISGRVWWWK